MVDAKIDNLIEDYKANSNKQADPPRYALIGVRLTDEAKSIYDEEQRTNDQELSKLLAQVCEYVIRKAKR
jgi:hypothetical protein